MGDEVFSHRNLPDGDWRTYRKTTLTRMVRMNEPFLVDTGEGSPAYCEDGWLAVDTRGKPYPIAAAEHAAGYELADHLEVGEPGGRPSLEEMDPNLVGQLRWMGSTWGPLGVARAAALLTSTDLLVKELTGKLDTQRDPKPDVEYGDGTITINTPGTYQYSSAPLVAWGPAPTVGRVVHYVSRGSADGVFPPACRAAHITELDPDDAALVGLCVLNPTGLFFHSLADGGCEYDSAADGSHQPGTWHWPERV